MFSLVSVDVDSTNNASFIKSPLFSNVLQINLDSLQNTSLLHTHTSQSYKLDRTSMTNETWGIGETAVDFVSANFYEDSFEVAPLADDLVFIYG